MGVVARIVDGFGEVIGSENVVVVYGCLVLAAVALAVIVNVFGQLVLADSRAPPMVFHLFPFIGSTVRYGMDPYRFFDECKKAYGDVFTFVLLGRHITVALGPKGNDFVFNAKVADVSAEEAYNPLTARVFGEDVVYDVPNHVLMEQKRFMKFGLTTETFRTYVPLIVEEICQYIKTSSTFSKDHGTADTMKIMPEITIFTASRTLQGEEVRRGLNHSFAGLYHDLDKGFKPINFIAPWMPLPANRLRDIAQRKMAQTYMAIIKKRRANAEHSLSDMISNLMNQRYKDGREPTDKEIAHMMIALLMAGQHTSAATSAWILLELGAKPHLIEALYEEQKQVLGEDLTPLTYENIQLLKLNNDVIRETLRLHPPLHSIMRKVKRPLQVPNKNYVVPAGYYVLAAPGASARDAAYFDNPELFDPYRWQNMKPEEFSEQIDYGYGLISKGGNSPYLPFGAGRHRCIGEQFAGVQLGVIVATLVRIFKWTLPEGETKPPKPDYNSMITLPSHPAYIEWIKRL